MIKRPSFFGTFEVKFDVDVGRAVDQGDDTTVDRLHVADHPARARRRSLFYRDCSKKLDHFSDFVKMVQLLGAVCIKTYVEQRSRRQERKRAMLRSL